MLKTKNIVIVGAGFAGLSAALGLEKRFKGNQDIALTLINKRGYFLFTPNLYEVASAEEEFTSVSQLKKSVIISLPEVLKNKNISFIEGELSVVDDLQRTISLGRQSLGYDYLVLALGSEADFSNVTGAETFTLTLNSLPDALRIRNAVEFAVQQHRLDRSKRTLRFVIAGGGPCSVKFAAELKGLLDRIAWKYGFPRENLEITVVESSGSLLPGLPPQAGRGAYYRLKELGVETVTGKIITGVNRHFVEFISGEKMEYDLLVWDTGRKVCLPKFQSEALSDRKGRLLVDENLQMKNHDRIFVIGDMGDASGKTGENYLGGGVDEALSQAKYLAQALPLILNNRRPRPYAGHCGKETVNIGGKWAMRVSKSGVSFSFWPYLAGQLHNFAIYCRLAGFKQACKNFWLQRELYGRND